jgi:hypothetical protein
VEKISILPRNYMWKKKPQVFYQEITRGKKTSILPNNCEKILVYGIEEPTSNNLCDYGT